MSLDAHRPGVEAAAPIADAVPVTVLTGFLGAGKSTLLASLLGDPPDGLTVRAVVNDIGALPFDPTLLAFGAGVEIELTNGCGCCEGTADLAAALDGQAGAPGIDLLVLEASGVADPLAVAQVVEARPALRVERIVTAVDGAAIEHQLADAALAGVVGRQLAAAHAVVVTNADRLPADRLAAVVDQLAERAPGRVIHCSTLEAPAVEVLTPGAPRGAGIEPTDGSIEHGLVAVTVGQGRPFGRADLERLLTGRPAGAIRGKGRLLVAEGWLVELQFTPTSWRIDPTGDGPLGVTVVATEAPVAASLAAELAGCSPSMVEAQPRR